jgi:hypothetical protein
VFDFEDVESHDSNLEGRLGLIFDENKIGDCNKKS